ncbi:MAG: uroporphyrinogen-III synthase [Corynebacterium sp.]|uniref:uroporphyrinogen-III synthase n=1 Tax=Corynebacterium sp. TaxID=1720 RepID=UPI0026DD15AF|nr:uroporphyrinogen-III synthase [Corynebacterium sp.]MDO5098956.1 uroporphyrinogen-III synthase [Corynebacterium sp.]
MYNPHTGSPADPTRMDKPLSGWQVVVPRARHQAQQMVALLEAAGATAVVVPTIEIAPPIDETPMQQAVSDLIAGEFEWLILTSSNAVAALKRYVEQAAENQQASPSELIAQINRATQVAVVGRKTAQAARDLGLQPALSPPVTEQNATGVVAVFPTADFGGAGDGRRVLLPRADIATDVVATGIAARGWQVTDVIAYRTVAAPPPPPEVIAAVRGGAIDAICVTSGSTIRNLVAATGKPHPDTIIACIGPMAAAACAECGVRVDIVPEIAEVPALIDALATAARNR